MDESFLYRPGRLANTSMKSLIIAAPFGNYLERPYATSTIGTFTPAPRGNTLYRWWRVVRTLRYNRRIGGWVNNLGLPNPGIFSVHADQSSRIVSVLGFSSEEWVSLITECVRIRPLAVELNLSCPNVHSSPSVADVEKAVGMVLSNNLKVIAKLPPVRWMDLARPLFSMGVRHFHLCNTIPTLGGGVSGKPLKQYSLWAVRDIRAAWAEEVDIIGGGGITGEEDVMDYLASGANRVSVASMLLNPLNHRKLESLAHVVDSFRQQSTSLPLFLPGG
jgi:dihydroorotate dehydrogenase